MKNKNIGCWIAILAIAALVGYIIYHNGKVDKKELLKQQEKEHADSLYNAGKQCIKRGHKAIIYDGYCYADILKSKTLNKYDNIIDTLMHNKILAIPSLFYCSIDVKNKVILSPGFLSGGDKITFSLDKPEKYRFSFSDIEYDNNVYLLIVINGHNITASGIEFTGACRVVDRGYFSHCFKGTDRMWKTYKEYEVLQEIWNIEL